MAQMTGDPDRDFLRMMSDHHKGLIAMAHDAKEKGGNTAKPIATRLDTKQDKELDEMVTMLERDYKDPYAPKIMPDNQQMFDDLKSKSGTAYDKSFLEHTVMHHEQAIKMINEYLPKGKNEQLKQMAQKMKADQTKEIAEFRQKASAM